MSTHSIISVVCRDGLVRSAYCHQDGYLQHNGRILVEHYNSQEKAEALIAPGNMSCLRARCDKPEGHTGDSPVEGVTVYWTRDAGCPADETAVRVYPDIERIAPEDNRPGAYKPDLSVTRSPEGELIYRRLSDEAPVTAD